MRSSSADRVPRRALWALGALLLLVVASFVVPALARTSASFTDSARIGFTITVIPSPSPSPSPSAPPTEQPSDPGPTEPAADAGATSGGGHAVTPPGP